MAELLELPLPLEVKKKVVACGFRTRADIGGITPSDLATATGITPRQALAVVKAVQGVKPLGHGEVHKEGDQEDEAKRTSAYDVLVHTTLRPIVTFCQDLDVLLGGGVQLCEVTEFCGPPGLGKTQLGIQLAVDAAIPEDLGGVGGEAIYIDTEGSFHATRAEQIASAMVKHVAGSATATGKPARMSVEKVLGGMHVFRCCNAAELVATCHLLPQFVAKHPQVKVVVIDSIAFHFRHDIEDMASRARLLSTLAQQFHELAYSRQLAVVIMNQVTTRLSGGTEAHVVPALGESWFHACTNRIMLEWQGQARCARLMKSTSRKMGTARYEIVAAGVRGAERKRATGSRTTPLAPRPAKRARTTMQQP